MEKSYQGLVRCAQFLGEMLKLGWKQSDLDELEKLWWQYRDRNGNLKQT